MKTLQEFEEFIREHYRKEEELKSIEFGKYKYPTDSENTFENFLEVNNVDEGVVTEDMMDWYSLHICDKKGYFDPYDLTGYHPNINVYINEMLEKTSLNLLKTQLNIDLGAGKENFVTNYTDKDDHVNTLVISKDIYDREKIMRTCDKMMWVFTSVCVGDDKWGNPNNVDEPYVFSGWGMPLVMIRVEPVKTKNITDFVVNECCGKIYHLCEKKNLDRILRSGLRVKGDKNDYRYTLKKVFFVCGSTRDDIISNMRIVIDSKLKERTLFLDDFTILEIDVNGYNIDFYQDGYYDEDVKYIGYTYNYFPPKRIKEVNIKNFYKEYGKFD